MFLLRQPSSETVLRFLESQRALNFSYSEVGATRDQPPPGFVVDHNRIRLGDGKETYERAVAALRSWRQIDLGWVSILMPPSGITEGTIVAVQAYTFRLWALSACRVVYVIDEDAEMKKYGFAYGTLPDHVECGEERFTVEWHADNSVWYDILAFSRPQHWLARVARLFMRRLQKQFAKESMAAMVSAANQ